MTRRLSLVTVFLGVAIAIPLWPGSTPRSPSIARSAPRPLGLACKAEYGVRLCAGQGTTDRIPSFDGVPLDADVTLPAHGKGPFPLVVMLHGLGASKTEYETTSDDGGLDNVTFASKGWAVLTYTARGFGNSCGSAASRENTPACAKGWMHLADQRFEVRDTQYLAGRLVDEGLARPGIAVTGLSYGAGQTLELAMLKDRMRLEDGRLVAWVSPARHIPMSIAAAYAEWGWDDLVTALVPNGALLTDSYSKAKLDLAPEGVEKLSWDDLLYGVSASNYLAPKGVDPSADLTTWHEAVDAGEPFTRKDLGYLREMERFHSAIGIPMPPGGPAPTVMQNGWTDTLFPVSEALHWSQRYTADDVDPPLLQLFDDVGHGWAHGKAADTAFQTRKAIQFLDDVVLSHTTPPTGVIAIGTTCPATAASTPRLRAPSWASLSAPAIGMGTNTHQTVASTGGSPSVASALNPAYSSPYCENLSAAKEPGTATYTILGRRTTATTLVGPLVVDASLRVRGSYPELIGRLWDVDPATHTRQLVEAGVYRPDVNEAPGTSDTAVANTTANFELAPALWTLPAGHRLQLELVGSTAPWFRASNGHFTIRVVHLDAHIAVAGGPR